MRVTQIERKILVKLSYVWAFPFSVKILRDPRAADVVEKGIWINFGKPKQENFVLICSLLKVG